MDNAAKKEQFNRAYVCAIAAQAGVNTSIPVVDDDSVDIILIGRGFSGPIRNPQIELQLKCTSQDIARGSVLKFPLSKKNYDDLRGTDLSLPRYLAVLVVPSSDKEWISHNTGHMSLHNICYWTSIKHLPDSPNTDSVTVDVPLSQRLDTDNLIHLLKCASLGVEP